MLSVDHFSVLHWSLSVLGLFIGMHAVLPKTATLYPFQTGAYVEQACLFLYSRSFTQLEHSINMPFVVRLLKAPILRMPWGPLYVQNISVQFVHTIVASADMQLS